MFPIYTHYRSNDYHNDVLWVFSLDGDILTNSGAAMVSRTGKLQVLVFGAAFNSGHPSPEEGKHVNVNAISQWSVPIFFLLSYLTRSSFRNMFKASKHCLESLVHTLNTGFITRFLFGGNK